MTTHGCSPGEAKLISWFLAESYSHIEPASEEMEGGLVVVGV